MHKFAAMILVCPDKYKGTLSAETAASIIAKGFANVDHTIVAPMADGGEGTARILCQGGQASSLRGNRQCNEWQRLTLESPDSEYFVNLSQKTAVIDSSAVIGLQKVDSLTHNILTATSAPLGEVVRRLVESGVKQVIIGIGGTATCDAGMGFIEALGADSLGKYKNIIVGLSDVSVPLVADGDTPSALMFAPQKGAGETELKILRQRMEKVYSEYTCRSPFDGAGGGLGFAIASILGAECHFGARYVLDHYNIDWSEISLVVTGEGCVDRQTSQGKVVDVVQKAAAQHDVPCVTFGGCVEDGYESDNVIATDKYYTDLPLNSTTAALRLQAAVDDFVKHYS